VWRSPTGHPGGWCNGSTADFGSACSGSNPDPPVAKKPYKSRVFQNPRARFMLFLPLFMLLPEQVKARCFYAILHHIYAILLFSGFTSNGEKTQCQQGFADDMEKM
jgi:hypothetical protein